MADLVGETVGAYTITQRLGRGGMADVYKALHTKLEVHRAIKFIRPEFVTSDDFRARFQKEAQGVARLRHPNIVQIHDFGEEDNRYFMVMEFVDGRTLKEILSDSKEGLPIDESVALIRQVADALAYAHGQDLIHRDIKPDNIMIDGVRRPVLMDFGIAKLLTTETQLTQTGMGIGTPAYMAPEQAKALEVGPPADIYALSIVLFEMLTGRVPFSADTPMAVMLKALSDPLPMPRNFNADISEALQGVIIKGTAKEPEQRFQNIAEFLSALDRAVKEDQPPAAAPSPPPEAEPASQAPPPAPNPAPAPAPEAAKTSKLPLMLGVLALLLLMAGGAWLFSGDSSGDGAEVAEPTAGTPSSGAAPPASGQPVAPSSKPLVFAYRQEIGAGETVSETLDLKAGDALYVDFHDTSYTTDVELYTPGGRKALVDTYGDRGPVVIPEDGAYELRLAMRSNRTGMVDVEVLKLPQVELDGGVVKAGEYFAGRTNLPGQSVVSTMDLEAGQTVFLDVVRTEVTTDFSLMEPDGRKSVFKSYADQGPLTVGKSGTYTLIADPRGDDITDFEINLHVLAPAVIDDGAFEPGAFITGSTAQPGQVVSRTVKLDAEDVVFFDVLETSTTTDFELTAPDGRTSIFRSYGDQGPVEVRAAGEYTLTADPRSDKLSTFEAQLHVLNPAVKEQGAYTPGELLSGATEQPGQMVTHTVALSAGDVVFMDVQETSATTDFELIGPDGRTSVFKSYADQGPLEIRRPGEHTLRVDPRSNALTAYEAFLHVLSPAVIDGGALTPGGFVEGRVEQPGQKVRYTVNLAADGEWLFEATDVEVTMDFRLIPTAGGEPLFDGYGRKQQVQIPAAASYHLEVDPRSDGVGGFAVKFSQP